MGMIASDLRAFLLGRTAITTITNRIVSVPMPEKLEYPAITFDQESDERVQTWSGASNHVKAIVNLDCWSKSLASARQLAEAVEADINGYKGAMGYGYCHLLRITSMSELYEGGTRLHRVNLQLIINHS